MKRLAPTLTRLFILAALVAGGYYAYSTYFSSGSADLGSATQKVKGLTSSLNLNSNAVIQTAEKKLVDSQPIINNEPEQSDTPTPDVQGVATSLGESVVQEASTLVGSATTAVSEELKSIPKDEAVKLIQNTCDQLISELEKE